MTTVTKRYNSQYDAFGEIYRRLFAKYCENTIQGWVEVISSMKLIYNDCRWVATADTEVKIYQTAQQIMLAMIEAGLAKPYINSRQILFRLQTGIFYKGNEVHFENQTELIAYLRDCGKFYLDHFAYKDRFNIDIELDDEEIIQMIIKDLESNFEKYVENPLTMKDSLTTNLGVVGELNPDIVLRGLTLYLKNKIVVNKVNKENNDK